MNKEEIEKMELEYTNAIRKRIENAMKCEIGLDATLTIGNRMIKLQDRIDKARINLMRIYGYPQQKGKYKDYTDEFKNIIMETLDILRGEDNESN